MRLPAHCKLFCAPFPFPEQLGSEDKAIPTEIQEEAGAFKPHGCSFPALPLVYPHGQSTEEVLLDVPLRILGRIPAGKGWKKLKESGEAPGECLGSYKFDPE